MSFLNELNDIQRAAVTTSEGPALIIAGPGSGKTRVLTFRIAYLLQKGVPPWEILALTFTNKAAKEMKERIEKVVGERAQYVWAGTFHSIFSRILRAEATKIGFPSNFTIYDTEDTTSLLRSIIREMSLDPQAYNAASIRSRISSAKSNLVTPKAYEQNEEYREQDRAAKRPFLHEIYAKYVARCKVAGAMDFDDLLFRLYELLRLNPENVREKYQQKFKYLLVDEFQDTNFLQYAILRYLTHYENSPQNLAVVGDDAQSIYAFRGATIDNILDFEKDYPKLKVFKLEQNYRSTHHIVEAANEVITFNKRQLQKKIFTQKTERNKIRLIKCMTDDEEARRVVDLILEHKNRYHFPNSEFAILYRTNAQSRKFEDALRHFRLPYRVYGGQSFYQRKEVKDFVAYLRLTVNPADEEAFRRVVNFPTRGIGESSIEKISQTAGELGKPMLETMLLTPGLTERTKRGLAAFRHLVEEWQKRAATESAIKIASDILRQSGLLEHYKADTTQEGISRLENIKSVLDAISEFTDQESIVGVNNSPEDRSLGAYLQTITLLTEADNNAAGDDVVTLMSVHSAKGLEYRSVFVTGMEENLFPSFMSFEDAAGVDEERRLFYVAITRAKDHLTLSFAQNRYRFGQMRSGEPSRFLEEIHPEHFEVATGIGAARGAAPTVSAPNTPRAGVSGNFATPRAKSAGFAPTAAELANFKASPSEAILPGVKVLHQKFGKGNVTSVEGPKDNRIAAIQFEQDDQPERRIVLKFAKLQVL